MKIIILPLSFLLLHHLVFGQTNTSGKEIMIDSVMRAHLVYEGKHPVHNFLIYAINAQEGFETYQGVGTIGRNDTPADAEYQYNIASITKTMVACVILQLEEEGKLSIKDNADSYLREIDYLKFDEIHVLNGASYAGDITIKHLLQHTSGIADIFTDAVIRFNVSVWLHRKRQYTTEKIVQTFYKYRLNKKSLNLPGEGYHYSDMNYMLLGFIIEQVTGKSLPQVIRERILEKLAMINTYFEYYEPEKGHGKRIDAFYNRLNMTEKINTSYEWGGGGLISTTKDMAVFIEALFNIQLFDDEKTLEKMIDISDTQKYGATYGMGIHRYELNDIIFYGHGGFYGSILAYSPENKITFSANIGQATPPYDTRKLVETLIDIIAKKEIE